MDEKICKTIAAVLRKNGREDLAKVVIADAAYTAKFADAVSDGARYVSKAIVAGDDKKALQGLGAVLTNLISVVSFMGDTAEPKSVQHLRKARDLLGR